MKLLYFSENGLEHNSPGFHNETAIHSVSNMYLEVEEI